MTLHHLYLLAPGAAPEEIRRFYETTLGLREVQPPVSLAAVPVLWFSAGVALLHIGYPPDGVVGGGHLALATPDLEAARHRFVEGGYIVDENVIPMGYPRFYVRDPWGNLFEVLPEGLS